MLQCVAVQDWHGSRTGQDRIGRERIERDRTGPSGEVDRWMLHVTYYNSILQWDIRGTGGDFLTRVLPVDESSVHQLL